MGWYFTILQEMRDMGLKGNELIVFAVINGFSQNGNGSYHGSLASLQEMCGISSRHTIIDILKSLIAKGLIARSEMVIRGEIHIAYSVCKNCTGGVQKLHTSMQNLPSDTMQNLQGGCAKFAHMESKGENKIIEKKDNITLPFASKEFRETWEILTQQPKWKKKSRQALEMSLKKLAAHTEAEAIEMMQNSIANDWQGVFEPDRKRTQQPRTKQDEFRYKVNDIWGMK